MTLKNFMRLGCVAVAVLAGSASAFALESITLRKIAAAGMISIGYRDGSVPFSYLDERRHPVGYSIDICLQAGVDINAVDSRGETALHGAAQKGWDQVVQYLADHGAKLNVKDQKGLTPTDAAMGLAGGLGFDNTTGDVHESTAALLRKLIAARQ